jgi:hypothetical protein
MNRVESRVRESNAWVNNPTARDANEMFEIGRDALVTSTTTDHGQQRRLGQMEYDHIQSVAFQEGLKVFFKGLFRREAQGRQAGGVVRKGKEPMSFSLYNFLCTHLLRATPSSELTFAHTFLILCWNLMCRATNGTTIRHEHMCWRGDALAIYFAHAKNDQDGEGNRDPRHIYANPLNPAICPILSLGIYWLCFPFMRGDNKLFEGSNQYDRFSGNLKNILRTEEGMIFYFHKMSGWCFKQRFRPRNVKAGGMDFR